MERPDHTEFDLIFQENLTAYPPACAEHTRLVHDLTYARCELSGRQGDPHAERSYQRALANIRAVQKDIAREEKSLRQLAFQQQRLEMQLERHQAFLARDARRAQIEQIKLDEAIRLEAKSRQEREAAMDKDHIQVEGDHAYIKQRIYIVRRHGKGIIEKVDPCNDEVRSHIALRREYPVPPTEVIRHYIFIDNSTVPPDYEYLLPDDETRAEMLQALNPVFKIPMTFAEFRETAAGEDAHNIHPEAWTNIDD